VGQGSALSSILSTFYITSIFYIFKKRSQNFLFTISVFTLSFIDNGLFISQEKCYKKSSANLFYSYSIIFSLFKQFGLTIEHNRLEVFTSPGPQKISIPLL